MNGKTFYSWNKENNFTMSAQPKIIYIFNVLPLKYFYLSLSFHSFFFENIGGEDYPVPHIKFKGTK